MSRMSASAFRIKSGKFRRGFAQGFGAPIYFFVEPNFARNQRSSQSLTNVWREVGNALREAEHYERESSGKTAGAHRKEVYPID